MFAARHTSTTRCGHSRGFCGTPWSASTDVVHHGTDPRQQPVPHSGEQVVEVLQKIDAPLLPEQVINVPKISQDLALQRMGDRLRQPQTAEQLTSAHDRVLFFSSGADCRADRRYSSSRSWRGRGCMWRWSTEFSCTCGADR